jgi:hypothetical protein
LQGGDDGGLGSKFIAAGARIFLFGLQHAFEELGDGTFASGGLSDFGAWGEDA